MQVVSVSSSPRHGFSKSSQPSIELLTGLGVRGDAHCGKTVQHLYLKRRDPAAPNRMQVHLLAVELLDELASKGFGIDPGDLGENILTRGVDLLALPTGARLAFGEGAVVELTCLRQPCVQIERFRPGLQREMYAAAGAQVPYRAGVMAIVLQGGKVQPGSDIRVLLPPEPHRPLAM